MKACALVLVLLLACATFADAKPLTLSWAWDGTETDGVAFLVERHASGDEYLPLVIVAVTERGYIDEQVIGGATYCYRLSAFTSTQRSAYSNEACGTAVSLPQVTLTVYLSAGGTVTASPGPLVCGAVRATWCIGTYEQGTTVVLTAVPSPGYRFLRWSGGGCNHVTGPCVTTLTASVGIWAKFGRIS